MMRKLPKALRLLCTLALLLALCTAPTMATSGVTENGESDWTYTATLEDTNVVTTGMYVLLVLNQSEFPTTLSANDILYIDQGTPATNGTITFNGTGSGFIPKSYAGGKAFVAGTGLDAPVLLGTLDSHGVMVSGQVKSYNPANAASIKVYASTDTSHTTALYTGTIPATTGNGQATQQFSVDSVSGGTYDLVVEKDCHIDYIVKGIVVSNTSLDLKLNANGNISVMTMLAGDVSADDIIDGVDLNTVWSSSNYNKAVSAALQAASDVNGDNVVDGVDLNTVWSSTNYNKGVSNSTFTYVTP